MSNHIYGWETTTHIPMHLAHESPGLQPSVHTYVRTQLNSEIPGIQLSLVLRISYQVILTVDILVLIVVNPQLCRIGQQGIRTRDRAQTRDLCSIAEFQPLEPPIPVKILRSQSPFSTGHGCVTIQRPLKTRASRLVLHAVWW